MVRKAVKQPQHLYLVAKINEVDVAYSASQNVGLEFRDSFDLNIKAMIEKIPDKFKRHHGKSMTMSFGSQRSFDGSIVTGTRLNLIWRRFICAARTVRFMLFCRRTFCLFCHNLFQQGPSVMPPYASIRRIMEQVSFATLILFLRHNLPIIDGAVCKDFGY